MPSNRAPSFKRWVCHMLAQSGHPTPESDISIYPLPTGVQIDPISCGLFALNAIGYHYLPQHFLLNSGSSTRLYGMCLTTALYDGAVRGQPVDSHVIIVTHQ